VGLGLAPWANKCAAYADAKRVIAILFIEVFLQKIVRFRDVSAIKTRRLAAVLPEELLPEDRRWSGFPDCCA
jgi:hypothetical protein